MEKKKRNACIVKEDVGHSFLTSNGKNWVVVKVIDGMEDDVFGSYAVTKKLGSIHKIKKKSSKKRNKKKKK